METTLVTTKTKWSIGQAHSKMGFRANHLIISDIRGLFKTFDANVYVAYNDFLTAEINLWIEAASIFTGDAKRDEHLKGADFFDVQNYKQIIFKSSSIGIPDAEGNHDLWGRLTMKGITKNIKLNVLFGEMENHPRKHIKAFFTITGKINGADWGIHWNATKSKRGILEKDEIAISCEVELIH